MSTTTTPLPLNQGQQEAADAFFEFLFSNDKEFILSGPAGVGKTFWMGHIIDVIMPRYHETCKLMGMDAVYDGVVMTATTNKAAEVLEQATARSTSTIHNFLNLIIYEDYDTGVSKLNKHPRNWMVHERMIVFIDECSMEDSQLYAMLMEGTHKCKIVHVGDRHQLAPVMEKISPVYLQNSPLFELTEQMRTSIPELQAANQQLRDTVESGVFKPIQIVPGIIDWLDDDQMQAQLAVTFGQPNPGSRILAYTNKRVIEFNDYIRNMRQFPDAFQAGEILVNASALKVGKSTISVESEITILKNSGRTKIAIGGNVELEVDYLDFTSHLGETFRQVPFPVDRKHFNDLLKYYKKSKDWHSFYNLKNNYPDFRPRDAATVHKAQGSTYDSVFIDAGNISTCTHDDQTARMLYVAFSRARSRVFLFGTLAQKYGGLVPA